MNIPARWTAIVLVSIATLLLIIHVVLYNLAAQSGQEWLSNLAWRFDVDQELSVPTWFAQILLFLGAVAAFFVARVEGSRALRKYWYLIAVLLLLMSIDEGASFHETIGVWVGQSLGWELSLGFAVLRDWVLLAMVAVLVAGLFLWRFVKLVPLRTRLLLAIAAILYVSGALIVETLHFTTFEIQYGSSAQNVSNAIEEGFEMFGAVAAFYAIADYAKRNTKPQKLTIS